MGGFVQNLFNKSNVSKVQPAPSSLFGSIVDNMLNRTKIPPGYVAPSPNATLPSLPQPNPLGNIMTLPAPGSLTNPTTATNNVSTTDIPGILQNQYNVSYPEQYNAAQYAGEGSDVLSQILGLQPVSSTATPGTQELSGIQSSINDLISTLTSQAAGGGLTPEYVQSQKDLVYDPMMETLLGNLNQMGGGVTNLGTGQSAELQRRATNDFMSALTAQGFQNQNQLAQTSMSGLDQILGNLQQYTSGQQAYGLGQESQITDIIKNLLAKYAIDNPNVQGSGSNWGANIAELWDAFGGDITGWISGEEKKNDNSTIGGNGTGISLPIPTNSSGLDIDIGLNWPETGGYGGWGGIQSNTSSHFGGSTDDYLRAMAGLFDPALIEQMRAAHVPLDSIFWDEFGTLSPAWEQFIDPYTAMVLQGLTG